jgi:hypothetical protein
VLEAFHFVTSNKKLSKKSIIILTTSYFIFIPKSLIDKYFKISLIEHLSIPCSQLIKKLSVCEN